MTDSQHSQENGQVDLKSLTTKAKLSVTSLTSPGKNVPDEQKMFEDVRASDERFLDDAKTAVEELTAAFEHIDKRSRELKNDHLEQLIEMREVYARKAYRFVWLWSVMLIVILILNGSKSPELTLWFIKIKASEFSLESEVLIALISGVTVNIVAVFIVVMRNLFPSTDKKLYNNPERD